MKKKRIPPKKEPGLFMTRRSPNTLPYPTAPYRALLHPTVLYRHLRKFHCTLTAGHIYASCILHCCNRELPYPLLYHAVPNCTAVPYSTLHPNPTVSYCPPTAPYYTLPCPVIPLYCNLLYSYSSASYCPQLIVYHSITYYCNLLYPTFPNIREARRGGEALVW